MKKTRLFKLRLQKLKKYSEITKLIPYNWQIKNNLIISRGKDYYEFKQTATKDLILFDLDNTDKISFDINIQYDDNGFPLLVFINRDLTVTTLSFLNFEEIYTTNPD
jgi:hypothetical protein